MKAELHEKLRNIQQQLNVPKSQTNTHGNYKYRKCEDILEAVKPLLAENKLALTITDDIVQIGERFYIKATITISDETGDECTTTGFARECLNRKGMDESQITGATSSYARKYGLNGMFLIDDTKDADTMDNREQGSKPASAPKATAPAPATAKITMRQIVADRAKQVFKDNDSYKNWRIENGFPDEITDSMTELDFTYIKLGMDKLQNMEVGK